MSIFGHEEVRIDGAAEEIGISPRIRMIVSQYGYSTEASTSFDRQGGVIKRETDSTLHNQYVREEKPVSVPVVTESAPLRTELPSFDPIRGEEIDLNGNSLWPGEDRSEDTSASEETTGIFRIDGLTDYLREKNNLLQNRRRAVFGVGIAAVSGAFKTSVKDIGRARDATLLFRNEKIINLWENSSKHKKKITIAMGVLALASGIGLFEFEDIRTNFFGLANIHEAMNHTHETAKHAVSHGIGQHLIDSHPEHQPVLTDPAHTLAIGHIKPNHVEGSADNMTNAGHVQEIYKKHHPLKLSVHIGAGDGPTQAIKKLFPGHSPKEYLAVFKEAVKLHGQNIFRGIPHYSEGHGLFGFSHEGTARLTKAAYSTISSAFKPHQ